jgi:hypothetical protein
MPGDSSLGDEPIEFGLPPTLPQSFAPAIIQQAVWDTSGNSAQGELNSEIKFMPRTTDPEFTEGKIGSLGSLVVGRPQEAAHGIADYMGIDMKQFALYLQGGVNSIRMEFEESGSTEDIALMRYVLDEAATPATEMASNSEIVRDKGHEGMRLSDFLQFPDAVTAKLEPAHIAALRIYSSQGCKCVNNPLRNHEKPHPFAATTLFLCGALQKLRAVNATRTVQQQELWRGMKDLELTEEFKRSGGTELGCLSTSTSKERVARATLSAQPLIFRVVSTGFMSDGIPISWVSLYPEEEEVLYPPMTYLKFLKATPIKNSSGFVVDVAPMFSS